jgi:hypothetical protein
MATNLYRALLELLPATPLLVGTVLAVNDDETVTVELPGGGIQRVRGVAAVDEQVFVKDGKVDSTAPELPFDIIEI